VERLRDIEMQISPHECIFYFGYFEQTPQHEVWPTAEARRSACRVLSGGHRVLLALNARKSLQAEYAERNLSWYPKPGRYNQHRPLAKTIPTLEDDDNDASDLPVFHNQRS
jgi:hypothetical protein